ncbi:catenin alpha-1 isoform X1 [Tachysurus ichikawai]
MTENIVHQDRKRGRRGIINLQPFHHASLQMVWKQIIVDPLNFSEERFRPSLEERLESIISGAALMADSSCTRDDRRERIVAECNSVRQALQDLLSEYMGNLASTDTEEPVCLTRKDTARCGELFHIFDRISHSGRTSILLYFLEKRRLLCASQHAEPRGRLECASGLRITCQRRPDRHHRVQMKPRTSPVRVHWCDPNHIRMHKTISTL